MYMFAFFFTVFPWSRRDWLLVKQHHVHPSLIIFETENQRW